MRSRAFNVVVSSLDVWISCKEFPHEFARPRPCGYYYVRALQLNLVPTRIPRQNSLGSPSAPIFVLYALRLCNDRATDLVRQ